MFRKRNSLVALCVWLVLMQGCKRLDATSSDLTLEHDVSPTPPRVGLVTITFRLSDAAGKPVTGAMLKLEGHMSHAGMVPVFAEGNETEPGRYQATLELSMAGDWIVLVTGDLPDKRKLWRQFEITGVAPV